MALMENWDLKNSNNRVRHVCNGSRNELHYIISDLGTTFVKTGGQRSPIAFFKSIKGSRNEPDDYVEDFIDEIKGNLVRLVYSAYLREQLNTQENDVLEAAPDYLSRLRDRGIIATPTPYAHSHARVSPSIRNHPRRSTLPSAKSGHFYE